jgi:hypothetical protein
MSRNGGISSGIPIVSSPRTPNQTQRRPRTHRHVDWPLLGGAPPRGPAPRGEAVLVALRRPAPSERPFDLRQLCVKSPEAS